MKKVLIVDDELIIQKVFEKLVKGICECEVVTASSVEKAKDALVLGKPDLILLDLNMGGDHGIYFVDWLKDNSDFKQIPIIVVSAMHQDEIQEKLKGKSVLASFAKIDIVGGGAESQVFAHKVKELLA